MTYHKHVTLTRSDLKPQFAKLPLEMISSPGDFIYPQDRLDKAETVIFRDTAPASRTIILKDQHGVFGELDTDGRILRGLMITYATVYPKYREFVEMVLGKAIVWEESK